MSIDKPPFVCYNRLSMQQYLLVGHRKSAHVAVSLTDY